MVVVMGLKAVLIVPITVTATMIIAEMGAATSPWLADRPRGRQLPLGDVPGIAKQSAKWEGNASAGGGGDGDATRPRHNGSHIRALSAPPNAHATRKSRSSSGAPCGAFGAHQCGSKEVWLATLPGDVFARRPGDATAPALKGAMPCHFQTNYFTET